MFETVASLAERAFRASAKYVFALNQSRLKVVTDPMYEAVAARLLPADTPLSPRLLAQSYDHNLFLEYRTRSRKLEYFIEDFDFSQAQPELLTPRQRQMMHTVALGETSGAAVADGFLRAFRTMPELAAFFGVWFVEELNHFLGYHLYLDRMGERWPAERGLEVAEVDFLPYADDPMEVAACNMYQELLGFLVYRRFASQVKDPFLANMLDRFAKDELRHYKFYQSVVARRIQQDPSFRRVVLKVFLKATSPYNQVSGGVRNVIDHLEAGAFYFRKPEFEYFTKQVEFLLGDPLEQVFANYFRGAIPPCTVCSHEAYQCSCESFDDGEPQPRRKPEWWKHVSPRPNGAPADIPIEAWANQLRTAARGPSPAARPTAAATASA